VDQVGHASPVAAMFQWDILSAVPSVQVLSRPDTVSSSWRPVLALLAQWGSKEPPPGGNSLLQFEFTVLGLRGLDTFHSPPLCPSDPGSFGVGSVRLPVDCVEAGCDGGGCVYRLALPHAPGTSSAYTLQMRGRLLSAYGRTVTERWTHVVCSTLQYAVLSGNDTIVCRPCPEGGDCSGGTLPLLLAAAPGAANAVVQQQHIVAREGYWASQNSSGLTYYRCPNTNALTCLQGVNGTRTKCATGYRGLVCNVCDHGCVLRQPACCVLRAACYRVVSALNLSVLLPFLHLNLALSIPLAHVVLGVSCTCWGRVGALGGLAGVSAQSLLRRGPSVTLVCAGTLSSTACVPSAPRRKAQRPSWPPLGSRCCWLRWWAFWWHCVP
jgi:hypothetical protein